MPSSHSGAPDPIYLTSTPAHHAPGGGFRNPWPNDAARVPFWPFVRWLLSGHGRTREARRPVPVEALARTQLDAPVPPDAVRATWLGHAAVLLQYAGGTVLTDPMFGERASPLSFLGPRRQTPLPLDPSDLPAIDTILISHSHYDHLDRDSVARLDARHHPLFVVPLGLGRTIGRWLPRADVRELDWGDSIHLPGPNVRVHAEPARHFSSRTPFDRDRTLWASYFLEPLEGAPSVYFAGDSGYGPHFTGVRAKHGSPDLALVPIGAYEPRWIMKPVHLDPDEAVQASLDLGARTVLGTHWGTFILTDEPMDEPPARFLEAAAGSGIGDRARVLPVGGTLDVPSIERR